MYKKEVTVELDVENHFKEMEKEFLHESKNK